MQVSRPRGRLLKLLANLSQRCPPIGRARDRPANDYVIGAGGGGFGGRRYPRLIVHRAALASHARYEDSQRRSETLFHASSVLAAAHDAEYACLFGDLGEPDNLILQTLEIEGLDSSTPQ